MAPEGRKILSILLIITSGLLIIYLFTNIDILPIIAGLSS